MASQWARFKVRVIARARSNGGSLDEAGFRCDIVGDASAIAARAMKRPGSPERESMTTPLVRKIMTVILADAV